MDPIDHRPAAQQAEDDIPVPVGSGPRCVPSSGAGPQEHLAELRQRLLDGASATATLEAWCREHGLAAAPLRALRVDQPCRPPQAVLEALRVQHEDDVAHRHVQLVCGTRRLSEADNWYVPARLTPAMQQRLLGTDTPFGRVVAALGFHRDTLSAHIHWPPVGDSGRVLQVQALLRDRRQRPISYVIESYLAQVLPLSP